MVDESQPRVALSFDVEEHHRIEAAAHLSFPPDLQARYAERMDSTTNWILDFLAERGHRATFFVVGQIARSHPKLIRRMADSGHEVASHSWDHRRVQRFTKESFREDVAASKDALEQAGGITVVGFRAPTFSVMRDVPWAIDVLAECGMRYDSSIFPVRHDRYGIPAAPRVPFLVRGHESQMLELPPLTLRWLGMNIPVAGGGYFRLFPLAFMRRGIRQMTRLGHSSVLYFHPWEFDSEQPKLPLSRTSKFRTYVGIGHSRARLDRLLRGQKTERLCDLAERLQPIADTLPTFSLP